MLPHTSPTQLNRLIVVGRDAVHQVAEKFLARRQQMIDEAQRGGGAPGGSGFGGGGGFGGG